MNKFESKPGPRLLFIHRLAITIFLRLLRFTLSRGFRLPQRTLILLSPVQLSPHLENEQCPRPMHRISSPPVRTTLYRNYGRRHLRHDPGKHLPRPYSARLWISSWSGLARPSFSAFGWTPAQSAVAQASRRTLAFSYCFLFLWFCFVRFKEAIAQRQVEGSMNGLLSSLQSALRPLFLQHRSICPVSTLSRASLSA